MPTVLSLSSQVARGHVGHSANMFVWQRLGIDVISLPTIILSNRPDCEAWAGERVNPQLLGQMVSALDANGFLGEVDAIFTGYLPSAAHAEFASGLIERMKTAGQDLLYCCDPILGDEPGGLYVAEDVAAALRDRLMPLADIVTPNRFELGWLTGGRVTTRVDAVNAARSLGAMVLATSAPNEVEGTLINLLVNDEGAWQAVVNLREAVPHGTGDFIAALFFAHLLRSEAPCDALALATSATEAVIGASEGRDELDLVGSQESWAEAGPWPFSPLLLEPS
jgi:pyridoxine kinase